MKTDSTENLIDAIKRKEKKRRSNTLWVIAILSSLALVTLLVNVLTHVQYEKDSLELEAKKDLLSSVDSIRGDALMNDSLMKSVFEFYSRKLKPDSVILSLFSDTLERYYLLEGVSRKKVLDEDKRYWKKYPGESMVLDSSIATSLDRATGRATAIARCRYCRNPDKCSDLVTVFKFDKSRKIYYVRSYFDVEGDDNRLVFGNDTLPAPAN